jgi:hypothetical protein
MGIPQLITALIGGVFALMLIEIFKNGMSQNDKFNHFETSPLLTVPSCAPNSDSLAFFFLRTFAKHAVLAMPLLLHKL